MGRFVVARAPGPAWDPAELTRQQSGWDSHAAFMDRLTDERFVAFGGPAGDGTRFVLIVDASDQRSVRAQLALDPWELARLLRTIAVEPWTVWLGGDERIARERPLQLVTEAAGPRWDDARPRRQQAGWEAHAAFMDALSDQHVVLLGGPLDERRALLVMRLDDEAAVRARLATDPWADGTLTVEHVEPWTLWLRAGSPP